MTPRSGHETSTAVIRRGLELGVTLIDTGDMYGPYLNDEYSLDIERDLGRSVPAMKSSTTIAAV